MRSVRHHRRLAVAAAALVAAATMGSAGAAYADPVPVPDGGSVTLSVVGNGHGHGMSQWGAEGAARAGKTAAQILGFYYPGTSRTKVGGTVTVLLSKDDNILVVRSQRGLTLTSVDKHTTWKIGSLKAKATKWRIVPVAGGSKVEWFQGAGWRQFRTFRGEAQFAAGAQPVKLVVGTGTVAYRGALRSSIVGTGLARQTHNLVSLESYVRGVVPSEVIASSWHPAAIQAQAVAARTYAAYERAHSTRSWDLCDTSACQVYGGASAEYPTSDAATARTAGLVVTDAGQPAFAQFSASNGGWTSAGAQSYLPAQRDPYDGWAGNPYRAGNPQTARISDTMLEKQWPAVGDLDSVEVTERDGNGTYGGRVVTLTLTGSGGTVTVSGDSFRSRFGLRSTMSDLSAS